jgi:hypothetical protein
VGRAAIEERWTVVADDAPCEAAFASLACLELRRERLAGGDADKTYRYARGVGKVTEEGETTESLLGCVLQ